jgi:hypothetical protein
MYLTGQCQDTTMVWSKPEQKDLKDWLLEKGILKKKKPPKSGFLLVIPVIASNPTAGFLFGAGLTYAFKRDSDHYVSTASSNATYSTKGLLNLNMKTNFFLPGEKVVLNGDWRYLHNIETTYGLGTASKVPGNINVNGYDTGEDSTGQSLNYRQVRLHETASFKVIRNVFAGIGFQYDYFYNIDDDALSSGDTLHSYQYQYSTSHGFDPQHYNATGICINVLYDSRDNQVNAYKGMYANANFRMNMEALGSTQKSTLLLAEYRGYISMGHQPFPKVLAFWLYGNFVTSGNVPYLLLPSVGYDQRQKTGRGYTYGRFRGEDMVYGETEYRFPISERTGILGGILYVNCTTTSDRKSHISLFDYLRPAYGGGLRVMMDKKTRTRLEIDAGIAQNTVGFYFGVQETF